MPEVGAFEAKSQFSRLLARARAGEEFTITLRGAPIAKLVPVREAPTSAKAWLAQVKVEAAERRGAPFTIDEILSLRDEGRR